MSFTEAMDTDLAMQPIFHNCCESQSRLLHSPEASFPGETNSVASQEQGWKPGDITAPSSSDARWQRRSRRKLRSTTIHSTACLLVCGLVVASTWGSVVLISRTKLYGADKVCDPSGNFNPAYNNPSFWSPSRAFQITLGFGAMSFSDAKLIDVAWDVVVGRGGQALLAFISYCVFTKNLTRLMEHSSVNLVVFESLAMCDTVSVVSIYVLMRDFVAKGSTRAKLSTLWIIVASVYALFFQTLMSAMTGYSASTSPYVPILPDGIPIPWANMRSVMLIVHDGWRIGLTGNYLCTDLILAYDDPNPLCIEYAEFPENETPPRCMLLNHIYNYTFEFCPYGGVWQIPSNISDPRNFSSTIELPPPTLNITFVAPNTKLYTPSDQSNNQTYNLTYLEENGICSQEKTYRWGFSSLLLFFAILLTTVWAIGMWIMWLDAYYQSNLDLYGRQLGRFRAALDLAEVLQRELGKDSGTDQLSDQALRRRTTGVQFNATISYTNIVTQNATSNRSADFGRWLQQRRWGRWVMKHKRWTVILAALTLSGLLVLVVWGVLRAKMMIY